MLLRWLFQRNQRLLFLNKVFVARSGVFLEREFLSKKNSGSKVQFEEVRETHENDSSSQEDYQLDLQRVVESTPVEPEVRRSERTRPNLLDMGFV